jgi:hypothetical protein
LEAREIDHEARAGEGGEVLRREFDVVRLGPRFGERGDGDVLATDPLDGIRQGIEGRDHVKAPGARCLAWRAGTAAQGEQGGGRDDRDGRSAE